MHQIGKGIFFEDSFLGVTLGGMVFSHGIIYIDSPLRIEDARNWRSALLSQRGGNQRLLINLDSHPDRTLGARSLDCTIVAHQKTAQVFRNRPSIFKGQSLESGAAWEDYSEAIGMRWATPDITFTQMMSLHWGGPEVILEYHPGPTSGASWVIIPDERVIFLGDSLVVGQPPFLASADLVAWLNSLEILMTTYKDFTMIAGRGGAANYESVQILQQGIKNTLKHLEKLAKHHAPPESTDDFISTLMSDFAVPEEKQGRYLQRLSYGLYQFYSRRYRPSSTVDSLRSDESEQ